MLCFLAVVCCLRTNYLLPNFFFQLQTTCPCKIWDYSLLQEMWGGGGGALQFHTFSLLFFNLETSSVLAWLDWLNLFQVFSEGDSLSFTGSEMCLALKQIFFFKVWGVFILLICFLEIIACTQNKGKFQIGQVVLRGLVCNRSGLLMDCFENMLSLERKYCSDLCVLPLPPHQPSFKLV